MKYDYTVHRCWHCQRDVKFPRRRYKEGQPVFCSTACNKRFVAEAGEAQKQNARKYGSNPA